MALAEADGILLRALASIGCELPEELATVDAIDAPTLFHCCARCVREVVSARASDGAAGAAHAPPSARLVDVLPDEPSRRFRSCTALASEISRLGYAEEIGFNDLLYPDARATRRLLSFLIELLPSHKPTVAIGVESEADEPARSAAPTRAQLRATLAAWSSRLWLPLELDASRPSAAALAAAQPPRALAGRDASRQGGWAAWPGEVAGGVAPSPLCPAARAISALARERARAARSERLVLSAGCAGGGSVGGVGSVGGSSGGGGGGDAEARAGAAAARLHGLPPSVAQVVRERLAASPASLAQPSRPHPAAHASATSTMAAMRERGARPAWRRLGGPSGFARTVALAEAHSGGGGGGRSVDGWRARERSAVSPAADAPAAVVETAADRVARVAAERRARAAEAEAEAAEASARAHAAVAEADAALQESRRERDEALASLEAVRAQLDDARSQLSFSELALELSAGGDEGARVKGAEGRARLAAVRERFGAVRAEWERVAGPLRDAIARKAERKRARRAAAERMARELPRLRSEAEALAPQLLARDVELAAAEAEASALLAGTQPEQGGGARSDAPLGRAFYTERVHELTRALGKQQAGINAVLADIAGARKRCSAASEQLRRAYVCADERVFLEATRDRALGPAYKALAQLHGSFAQLSANLDSEGALASASRELEARVKMLEGARLAEAVERLSRDVRALRAENDAVARGETRSAWSTPEK